MGQAGDARAQFVERLEQAQIGLQRVAVLDAQENDPLVASRDRRGVVRLECELEGLGVGRDHFADRKCARDGKVSSCSVTRRRARPLRRVDGPKSSVQTALDEAREIHLAAVPCAIVTVLDIPARQREVSGRIEVCIEREKLLVQCPRGVRDLLRRVSAWGVGQRRS